MSQVNKEDAIIFPKRGKGSPHLGPVAIIAGTVTDLSQLCKLMGFDSHAYRRLFTSRLYLGDSAAGGISLTGPAVGAPYAVMLLEMLIAWGAKKILFLGWCGSISEKVKIGDIIVATSAIVDEGTSRHYQNHDARRSHPAKYLSTALETALDQKRLNFHKGTIWTTDAIYRETGEKVKCMQRRKAIGVEMEISALFTVAKFRGVDVAALAVVSDELASFKWLPGFKTDEFRHGRMAACRVIKDICRKL